MSKLTVLVDLDEVVVGLVDAWLEAYEARGGERLTRDQLASYDMRTQVKDAKLLYDTLDHSVSAPLLLAKPFPGALRALLHLYDTHDVYLVTYARFQAKGHAHRQKLEWLHMWAPWFDQDRVIFAKHKHLVQGDVLVEDNVDTLVRWCEAGGETGRVGYLVTQPWNVTAYTRAEYGAINRVNSLAEVADILCGADNE